MKKLMIAAAIVCAAVVSQAAQVNWRAANVKDITGEAAYSGAATLYLTDNSTKQTQTFSGSMAGGAIQQLIGDSSAGDAGFIVAGHSYSGYYTMTDKDGNIFTSGSGSVNANFPQAMALMTMGGSWQAVPEPTSGLLLLLGVAGLALRRRRA